MLSPRCVRTVTLILAIAVSSISYAEKGKNAKCHKSLASYGEEVDGNFKLNQKASGVLLAVLPEGKKKFSVKYDSGAYSFSSGRILRFSVINDDDEGFNDNMNIMPGRPVESEEDSAEVKPEQIGEDLFNALAGFIRKAENEGAFGVEMEVQEDGLFLVPDQGGATGGFY